MYTERLSEDLEAGKALEDHGHRQNVISRENKV